MRTINLPAGTTHIPFSELAHLIADALWPETGPDDDRMAYAAARINLDSELARAVDAGLVHGLGANSLPVKDPLTLGPHTFPVGAALHTALVTLSDVRAYVAERDIQVLVANTGSNTNNNVQTPKSDIEMRLQKLPPEEAARWENADRKDYGRRHITSQYAGLNGVCLMTLYQFCDEVEERLTRWSSGQYLLVEAAQVLADANSALNAESLRKQMEQAIQNEKLTLRHNGIPVLAAEIRVHRLFIATVLKDDVNKWLLDMSAGYALVFPYEVSAMDALDTVQAAQDAPETSTEYGPKADALTTPEHQNSPEFRAQYAEAWDSWAAIDDLDKQIKRWETASASTVRDLELKEQKIAALKAQQDAHRAIASPATPQQPATQSLTAYGGVEQTPDSERRLALLRALGGNAKYAHGEWKFTGTGALVDREKADGRKRSDPKTIRADLKEAAQAESDSKKAGVFNGLGQR